MNNIGGEKRLETLIQWVLLAAIASYCLKQTYTIRCSLHNIVFGFVAVLRIYSGIFPLREFNLFVLNVNSFDDLNDNDVFKMLLLTNNL